MQFSDLHIHSRYSDGMLWPEKIISIASKKKIKCISITDHDTIDSQHNVSVLGEKFNVIVVPGLELSTEYKEREIHILGYFINIHNENLKKTLTKIKESRIFRAKEIINRLNKINIHINFEDIYRDEVSIGRPHIANALVSAGYANNMREAFHQYLIKGRPEYVDRYKIHYKDALRLISECNGLSVLAHPGEIYKGISIEEIIKEFKVYGLKGIEVFHPSHTSKQINDYYNLAKKYSLVITGGSDCHGVMHDNELLMGSVGIDEKLTNKFLSLKFNK
ncbi:PHP domain-containing protein [Clostridium sp. SYSU_GA19001]|uniref:PHP domain-containing protein n=1 Tax=Clostridium caldaquaticum TaxID=2940653 RepID=UPI0020776470|nr:PHP domain-containing protein [Clostridium caldaquaticum]MCM8710645.1 PHP domain-containing protein [Clostridium caldaquaticum]